MVCGARLLRQEVSQFRDKVVFISGSSQGIGKGLATSLGEQGAKIVLNGRNEEKLQATAEDLRSKGIEVLSISGDVSSYADCQRMMDEVIAHHGQLDWLVNNAGMSGGGKLEETKGQVYEQIFGINVLGSIYLSHYAIPHLRKTKGGILFISSVAGMIGLPSYTAYSASKRAVIALAESLRIELHDDGIFVGVNFPGFTENEPTKQIYKPDGSMEVLQKRAEVKATPLSKTVGRIEQQMRRRKFYGYSSAQGWFVRLASRLFPRIVHLGLKANRKKIMEMQ
jgi:NAD(P)-dependent dehydrogenase (short-subunit alcohol dehydrogenase family)